MLKKSVIVVEADLVAGRQVFAVCHKMGFNVRVFRDALDALRQAARSKPDLMVFDADLPVVGSLDFADVVSRDPQFKSVALLAIVDESDAVALRRCSAHGIAVAVKGAEGKALGGNLSLLLRSYAARDSSLLRHARCNASEKGAA